MKFEEKYQYSKDAEAVMRMFSDRDYFEKKYAETTTAFKVLEHSSEGGKFRIKCQLTMPSNVPIPGFAKKFLGETMTVVQEDIWDTASKTGRLNLELSGAPVNISADMQLADAGSGAENTVNWNVQCKVPLVGGKVEKLVADDIRAKSPADLAISEKLLADY